MTNFLFKVGIGKSTDVTASAFSLFNAVGIVAMIIGILFSKLLAKRFGKRDVFMGGIILSSLILIVFKFLSPTAVAATFVTQIFYGLAYGVTIPLLWAMVGDVADFSEWKNKRRATGIVFSALLFGLKAGLSIGRLHSVVVWVPGKFTSSARWRDCRNTLVGECLLGCCIFNRCSSTLFL